MKINELRVLIQEAIAEETAFLENETPKDKPETKEMTFEELLAAVKKMVTDKQKAAQLVNAIKEGLNENLNEGFFGPSKKDIADFEAELEALIKDKKLENVPDLEKMKEKVRATAKTSGFKGGKLGYQAAGTNKRTGNKVPPHFYYSTDSTTTGR
jgi:hypothetical protein